MTETKYWEQTVGGHVTFQQMRYDLSLLAISYHTVLPARTLIIYIDIKISYYANVLNEIQRTFPLDHNKNQGSCLWPREAVFEV